MPPFRCSVRLLAASCRRSTAPILASLATRRLASGAATAGRAGAFRVRVRLGFLRGCAGTGGTGTVDGGHVVTLLVTLSKAGAGLDAVNGRHLQLALLIFLVPRLASVELGFPVVRG